MYTAMVTYTFRPEALEEGVAIWEAEVLSRVQAQPGFRGVQLYTRADGAMLAVGSWNRQEDAQAFMRTGVFKDLTARLAPLMTQPPDQGPWDRRHLIVCE